ncbi:hypothetical protein ACJ5H2_09855 [Nocardioides sp. R1-1]|uniref:hypothetical protein n=1 Tax=Nocardioides sp. R1-1 TaxID=3383502 RepID=UPI0038D0B121
MGRTGKPADLVGRNLRALHGALEHSVTIQMTRLQSLMDDLVARGSLTRDEADSLLGQLVSTGKAYSQALLQVLDTVRGQAPRLPLVPSQLLPGRRRSAAVGDDEPTVEPPPLDNVETLVVPDLDTLTVPQVKARIAGLGPTELRRVQEREIGGKNRKGVLAEIDRLLRE